MGFNMERRMRVLGVGVVSVCGRGIDAFRRTDEARPFIEEDFGIRVCRLSEESLKDRNVLKGMRRADRFSKMAVLAAHDAYADGMLKSDGKDTSTAIIITTAFGPHKTTFGFLDEILDFGDAAVSPTRFSHSVHNAAASYVATALKCRGPACTIADFEAPLFAGLTTAELWLRAGRCEHALVGYVEQVSKPMTYAAAMMAKRSRLAALQPFNLSPFTDITVSEGSVFLAIGKRGDAEPVLDLGRFSGERGIRDTASLLRYLGKELALV